MTEYMSAPTRFDRRSIRLKGYDYTWPGEYFVTICAKDYRHLFGTIEDGEMHLNDLGRIVEEEWLKTSELRENIYLDEFIVMPNHLHGIVIIHEKESSPHHPAVRATRWVAHPMNHPNWVAHPMNHPGCLIIPSKDVRATRWVAHPSQSSDQSFLGNLVADHTYAESARASVEMRKDLGGLADGRPSPGGLADGRPSGSPVQTLKAGSLGAIIGQIKSVSSKRINRLRGTAGIENWHRNYYERVIRHELEFGSVQEYIINNPVNWAKDEFGKLR